MKGDHNDLDNMERHDATLGKFTEGNRMTDTEVPLQSFQIDGARDREAKERLNDQYGKFATGPRDYSQMPQQSVDMLSMLAGIHARLDAVEKQNAVVLATVNDAKENGDIGVDNAHHARVMDRWFHHEAPPESTQTPRVAKFDPFTGEPIADPNAQVAPKFDQFTGQRLN